MSHIVYKATSILSHLQEDGGGGFKDNCFTACLLAVTRFLGKVDFVYRAKTNEATRMIEEIDRTGIVYAPLREDILSWVTEVVWEMDRKPLMRNAWRKTGYDWFPGGEGVFVSDGDDTDNDDIARGSTQKNVIFSNSLWTNSE